MRALKEIDWKKVQKILAEDRPTLTEKLADKIDQYPTAKTILCLLAAGCVLTLAFTSPGFASLFGVWKSFNKRRFKYYIYRFKKQKYVEISNQNDQQKVTITTAGLKKVLSYKLNDMKIKEPDKWDGKWRLVIFDIQDSKKSYRNMFRDKIRILGLWQLQESVYIYPYNCFDQIEFIRQIYGVGLEVKYIVASSIEDDENLLNHFNL